MTTATTITMSPTQSGVQIERPSRELAVLRLTNPGKLNSFTLAMWEQLDEAVATLGHADSGVRCIVIRGADPLAFAAGSDISEFRTGRNTIEKARTYGIAVASALQGMAECDVPLLALIQGSCVGGGLAVAASCDIRIAGKSSKYGVPVNRLGLVMAHAEMRPLYAAAGPAAVRELLLEGRIIKSDEALAKGLISRVVEDAEVETAAFATASAIIAGAPLVARWHKQFIRRLGDPAPLSAQEIEEAYKCFESRDYGIGLAAFENKTKPTFVGK